MDPRSIQTEAIAAAALLRSIADTMADDDDTAAIVIEGETNLIEAITAGLERIEQLTAYCAAIKARQDDMAARRQRYVAQIDRIKTALQSALVTTNQRKLETPLATLSLRRLPPKVEVIDPQRIPAAYMRQRDPEPDKVLIAAALKDGMQIDGVTLSNGGETIGIKTR